MLASPAGHQHPAGMQARFWLDQARRVGVAAVAANVASGAPLVRCQLLASEFYEALKRELRATSELGVVERAMVVAAANQCRHAATASISPGAMLVKCQYDKDWRAHLLHHR